MGWVDPLIDLLAICVDSWVDSLAVWFDPGQLF